MTRTLVYAGQRLVLRLPDGEHGLSRFLAAYFVPYFGVREGADDALAAVADLTVHVGTAPLVPPELAAAEAIDVDRSGGFLRCRGRALERRGVRWVWLEPFGALVRVEPERRSVDVWGPSGDALRVPVLRLVEDLILNEVQRAGAIVVHASAVVVGGRAIVAIGNKGAGKTTALCRLMSGFEAAKMANDTVCLFERGGAFVARGWPSFFKASVGTVAAHTELAGDFPPDRRSALASDAALWGVYEKVALFPRQAADRFGAALVPEAPLGGVIFPVYTETCPPELRDVPPAETVDGFAACLQGVDNANHTEWIGLNPVATSFVRGRAREFAAAVAAAGVPVVRLRWGPSLDDLLARLPLLRPARRSLIACADAPPVADAWPPLPTRDPDSIAIR